VLTGFLFITVGVGAQMSNIAFGLWFAEVFVFFAAPFVVLRMAGYDAFKTAGLSRPWVAGAVYGFVLGAVNFFAVVVPLQIISQRIAPKALVEMFDVSGIFKQQTPFELFGVVTGVCLAAPFCEEFFFRGLMQRGAEKALGARRALLATSIVFSAFHLDPIGFLARCELGFIFGLLMLRAGSIWPGVFAHLANNSVSVAIYFATRGSDEEEDLAWWMPLAMFAAGAPLMYGLWQLGKRWAAALTPPWRAEEVARPVRHTPTLVAGWVLAALLSFAALVTFDGQGVRLNLFDTLHPLKEPKKTDSEEARQQWEALFALRKEVRRGDAKLSEYEAARRAAIADRLTKKESRSTD
jgi:membrane protease YdiL (CAAX protease family)